MSAATRRPRRCRETRLPPENPPARRSRIAIPAVLALLGLGAAGVVVQGMQARQTTAERLQERAEVARVPLVSVVEPTPASTEAAHLELPGRIEPHSRALIHARVAGYLKRWHADIGTAVRAGQLLAEIETPELDQQLMQARAELASAQAHAALSAATTRRWESLQAQNFVSVHAVEEKRGDLAVRQAQVAAVQANVDRLETLRAFGRVVAPFDGVITARATDIGALVNPGGAPGTELFVLSELRRLRLYVQIPQNQVAFVRQGDKAEVLVPERPGERFGATVQALSQAIGTASGSMQVQLALDNARGALLPGGFARVRFARPASAAGLAVPASALIFGKAGPRVAVVDGEGRAAVRQVAIARDFGATVELAQGVVAGDRVIDNPPEGIRDGDQVTVKAR
jgi:RND family efflux transporter MFP subunit